MKKTAKIAALSSALALAVSSFALAGCTAQTSQSQSYQTDNQAYAGQVIYGQLVSANEDTISITLGKWAAGDASSTEVTIYPDYGDDSDSAAPSRDYSGSDSESDDLSPNQWENPAPDADYESPVGSALEPGASARSVDSENGIAKMSDDAAVDGDAIPINDSIYVEDAVYTFTPGTSNAFLDITGATIFGLNGDVSSIGAISEGSVLEIAFDVNGAITSIAVVK